MKFDLDAIMEEIQKREQEANGAALHMQHVGLATGTHYQLGYADALAWVREMLKEAKESDIGS